MLLAHEMNGTNKNFKSARNDLESIGILSRSVPAVIKPSGVSWRGIMGLIHCPNSGPQPPEYPRFLHKFGDNTKTK